MSDQSDYLAEVVEELQSKLAEEKEKLTEAKADILEHHLQDEECRKAAGEFDKSDSFGIESPLYIIERMKAEIEAMRPVVEKVSAYRIKLIAYSPAVLGSECVTAQTEMFKALDEYEARKQP